MKIFSRSVLVLMMIVLMISCKKDDPSKTELLTGKNWITTGMTIDPPIDLFGIQISDIYSLMDECSKDNYYRFETDGTWVVDDGATKCDSADVQTITGIWFFSSDETEITCIVEGDTVTQTIDQISDSKIVTKISEMEDNGLGLMLYTITTTMEKQN